MARTYILNSISMNGGQKSSWANADWNSYSKDSGGRRVGKTSWGSTVYRCTNILFDQSTLASLRTKTITSIKLTLTFDAAATIPSSGTTAYAIGYKLNNTASTDTSSDAWRRSDADSTEASTTAVAGYMRTDGSSQAIAEGGSYTFDLTGSSIPVYGYTLGANTSGTGGYFSLADGAVLTVVTTETLTLSYDANGGSGVPSSESGDGTPNASFTVSDTAPTRQYYTFRGWATSASASTATYQAGDTISISENTTLYAVWQRNTATITYNANGGSGAPSPTTFYEGGSATLASASPTRTGYTFKGWSASDSAATASYQPSGTYTFGGSTILYAVWEAITYTVSYNANGGEGAPSSQTKTYNVALTLSSVVPTRANYSFLGWSTNSGASAAEYAAGGSFTVNANTTLYAVWKLSAYTISYNLMGGDGAVASQTKTHGVNIVLVGTPPTKSGYVFGGWDVSSAGTTAVYQFGDTFSTDADTILYAVWLSQYTVTYVANDATNVPTPQTKTQGIPLTLSSLVPVAENKSFLYWEDDDTHQIYGAGGTFVADKDTTLSAVWKDEVTSGAGVYVVVNGAVVPVKIYVHQGE